VNTVILDTGVLQIPDDVVDLASFRSWVHSPAVPEKARVSFLRGDVVVDMTKEQLFSHNQVKQKFNLVVGGLIETAALGRYFPDGVLVSNVEANLSSQPDGVFVSRDSFLTGRVTLIEGAKKGFVELEGSPELVIEVVSDSSTHKDAVVLRDLYWRASIPEYWLVDARKNRLLFEILQNTKKGFKAALSENGWQSSAVLAKSVRLTRRTDSLGHPEFILDVKNLD
jgi:Uma2 family endonuclease